MQVKNNSQVEPSFSRPDIADVARPLLVRLIGVEVPVQQVWPDVERMVAVRRDLVFLRSFDPDAVLAHQTVHTAMTDVQADLLQLFGHSWPAVATKAQAGLFFDVCKRDHIRSLSATGRATTEGPQATCADANDTA